MRFFTRKSNSSELHCVNPTGKQLPPGTISRRLSLWISIIYALLLLMYSTANAARNSIPSMPGPISGQTNVCAFVGSNQPVTYSISPVDGAAVYLWTVPATVQIVSGQGTTSISVTFSSGFNGSANKQLRVRAISQEGNSADRI